MKQDDIIGKIRSLLSAKLGVDECDVVPEADLDNDLGADSIDRVELLILLESEFKIRMNEERGAKVKTVQEVYDFLIEYVK